jgi:uncharacterized protein
VVDLLKICIVFFVTLALTFKRVALWISLLVATFLLGALFHLPVKAILIDVVGAAVDLKTLFLVGALFLILFFSNLLKETGQMNEILLGFRSVFKDVRVVVAMLPAMIGLMPIMGGALVSAPMVVKGSDELGLSPERRTFVNYWFRHLWEYILPTYPAFLVATALMGVPVRQFAWLNFPLTLAAVISGIFVGFRKVPRPKKDGGAALPQSRWRLFRNLFPLVFALTLTIAFKVELLYAFGLTVLGVIVLYRIDGPKIWRAFKESSSPGLLLTVVIIMGFKKVLESSHAIPGISAFLTSSGIPLWLIAILIPLSIGIITGTTIGPMGIGFPILIPLLQNDPHFLPYMSLAFASGVSGDLLSPFHLCLVLTKDYFKADLIGVYRLVWVPVAAVVGTGLLVALLLNA